MKKIVVFLITFLIFNNVSALDKKEVTFKDCVDGDTAKVIMDNEEIKIRFLAVDTPETKHPTKGEEPYGKDASNYTCNALTKASKIEIEYDENSDKTDKYDRHLVWVFVDGELLQEKLIEKGLAKVAYLYGDYKYTTILEAKELIAKTKQVGIWNQDIDYMKLIIGIIVIIVIVVLFISNQKFRKKTTNKIKRNAKKELKKLLK